MYRNLHLKSQVRMRNYARRRIVTHSPFTLENFASFPCLLSGMRQMKRRRRQALVQSNACKEEEIDLCTQSLPFSSRNVVALRWPPHGASFPCWPIRCNFFNSLQANRDPLITLQKIVQKLKSNHNCLVHNAESIYYLLCLFEAGSQLKLSARIETSVLLYRHCAAEVIGLAKSCLLAENSWEKNRHYCSREKCYFFSTSSTADPAVQYYSISCWERPTVRPKIIRGIQNSPWGLCKGP